MVFESLVVDVLNRFLGDYVVNLDSSQLKLGIWGGKTNSAARCFFAGAFLARSRKLAEAMLTAASRPVVPSRPPRVGLPSAVSVTWSARLLLSVGGAVLVCSVLLV